VEDEPPSVLQVLTKFFTKREPRENKGATAAVAMSGGEVRMERDRFGWDMVGDVLGLASIGVLFVAVLALPHLF
jgi:hypothetical protein